MKSPVSICSNSLERVPEVRWMERGRRGATALSQTSVLAWEVRRESTRWNPLPEVQPLFLSLTHTYEHIFTHCVARTICAGLQCSLSEAVAYLVTLAWWLPLWDLLSNESLWSWTPPNSAVEGCWTCTQAVVKDRRSSEAGNAYVFSTVRMVSENVQRQYLSNVVLSRDMTTETSNILLEM